MFTVEDILYKINIAKENITFKRDIYHSVKKVLDKNQNAIIFGLRRTGKTTLLKQLNKEIKNSIYIDWSDISIIAKKDIDFFDQLKKACKQYDVVLFDEVQERSNWDKILFGLYNEFVANNICKIVAAGSSSLLLKPRELGLDRSARLFMNTLSFEEYIKFTKKEKTLETFEYFIGRGFPMYATYDFENLGFNELFNIVLKPVFTEDLQSENNRINTKNMMKLFVYLGTESFGQINESKISQKLGITRNTVRDYMEMFEGANILKRIYKINEHRKTGKNKKYKCYLNPHFYVWMNKMEFKNIKKKAHHMVGHIIEAYWIHQKSIPPYNLNDYYFLQVEKNKDKEIDFVTFNHSNEGFKTINEINYTTNPEISDLQNLYGIKTKTAILWVARIEKDLDPLIQQKLIYDI